jgi:lipoprotein-releasing system permease protein
MPYEFFLAIRHLRSRRKRRLVRVTTLIALTGIAMGVGALIVALALANGFRDEMRDKILRGTAHITVARRDGQSMGDYDHTSGRIRQLNGVVAASGTTYDGAVISGPKGSAFAVLRGIDASQHARSDIAASIIAGSSDPLFEARNSARDLPNVLLGAELATRTGLGVGSRAEIIPASSALLSNTATKRSALVAGTFRTGLFEYDSTWIYLPLNTAAVFAGGAHSASVISVQVKDIYDVRQTAARIRELLGPAYTTIDWQEANRPLFAALTLERRIGFIIIGLIIFIAALNITTTLIMVVTERRQDIAILNAMGATRKSIMGIFIIEGAMTGVIGALVGLLLGAATTLIVDHYKLISLPADVYSIGDVPLNLNPRDMALAAIVAIVLSIVATLYPARAAARMQPGELLRDA